MNISDNEAASIYYALEPYIKRIVSDNTTECLKCRSAIVIDADNDIKHATVRLDISPDTDDQNMELMNCTGKTLKTGDKVWVAYMYSLTNAFIMIKDDGLPWNWGG